MRKFAFSKLLCSLALASLATAAQSADIVRFNFNSNPADSSTTTGSTAPSFGSGTASLVGGTTGSFSSGTANGGSSDLTAVDNSAWQTTTYAAQGAGDKTRGVQFSVDTTGFDTVQFSYDLRHSNTSSAWEQVQYTLNGSTYIDIAQFSGPAGDTWFNSRTVDLSGIAGVSNNANFGVRVVASFAPSTSAYQASSSIGTYGTSGTWRFDNVSVSGAAIVASVPEPEGVLLSLAGFAAVGFAARRKHCV